LRVRVIELGLESASGLLPVHDLRGDRDGLRPELGHELGEGGGLRV